MNRMKWRTGIVKLGVVLSGIALLQGVALGAQVSERERSKGRSVEAPYATGLSISIPETVSACFLEPPFSSCVLVPAGLNERFVSIEVVDASGVPVPASVGPHDDEPGGLSFCGATTEPVPITPGIEVEVVLNNIDPSVPCPGLATTGVVKVTLSRRP